uniref:HORMA domain-containing protein n=1 Tax=Rhabditophanes sp. KR3021 TaxID=114890 RepID=A0AC35TND5_9BILA
MAVAPEQLDREKICPFLIKIFIVEKQPHQIKKYRFKDYPEDCIEYQTWFDCTLFELTKEIMDLRRNLFKRACQLEFRIIKFDSELKSFDGLNIGTTNSTHTEEIDDGKVKLSSTRFEIGNWIEVCIKPLEEKKVEHFSRNLKEGGIEAEKEARRGRVFGKTVHIEAIDGIVIASKGAKARMIIEDQDTNEL